uniref:TauD/TfdA-like domain-containing protein n=1 Tax=Megaselia scalaris TaxID=36166 RepID=T1GLP5_MEGSC
MFSEFVDLKHKDYPGQNLKLASIWLRDPAAVKSFSEKPNGYIFVQWSDGHESEYCFSWLWESQVQNLTTKTPMKSWNKDSILKENYAKIPLPALLASDDSVKTVVQSLITYGVAFISEVPPTTDMTEMAIRRMFPIMKTLFGEMFTFQDNPDHADTAYSKDFLGSHTDNTYFTDAAGLQILHCIYHNGQGGESTLVDSLKCIEELRGADPEAFELLSTVHVPAEYIDEEKEQHHYHSGPIIRLCPVTGELKQFRWNVYDRATFDTISQKDMPKFYEAFIKLQRLSKARKTNGYSN